MPTQYDDKKIIPQPFPEGTGENAMVDAIIRTLPDKTGKHGKYLMCSDDEQSAEWRGIGGIVQCEVQDEVLILGVN